MTIEGGKEASLVERLESDIAVTNGWRKHDGGPNPAPGLAVDLRWGIGIIERQPSDRVNWSFYWTWKPHARQALQGDADVSR